LGCTEVRNRNQLDPVRATTASAVRLGKPCCPGFFNLGEHKNC
jgi:hypothetical protein